MPRAKVSAVVLTLNEHANIEFCLRSVRSLADEIVLVDMMSDDDTVEIAQSYGAIVEMHQRVAGFDAARQKGLDRATGDWILSIDADEVLTPQLSAWIRRFVDSDPPYDVALLPRANVFLGSWLRSTPWWPGKPRLFRSGQIVVTADLHRGLVPKRGARIATLPKDPDVSMWHFARPSLESIMTKTNRYTTIQARQALAAGRGDPSIRDLFGGAFRELGIYVAKRGWRDGLGALAYALDRAYYRFMASAKRWDEARLPERAALYDEWRERILSGFPDSGRIDQPSTRPGRADDDGQAGPPH